MFTQDQAGYLLSLRKELVGTDLLIDLREPKIRFDLVSPDDEEWKFLVDVTNSVKKVFKISLHHLETQAKVGLLRVDYNGSHRNPESLSDKVPDICKPYVGRWFHNEPHIHIFVEGYRDLAWAVPLNEYGQFAVKVVHSSSDYVDAIREFARRINFVGKFEIQEAII